MNKTDIKDTQTIVDFVVVVTMILPDLCPFLSASVAQMAQRRSSGIKTSISRGCP